MARLGVVNRLINYLEHVCPCMPASLSASFHLGCLSLQKTQPLPANLTALLSSDDLRKKSTAITFSLNKGLERADFMTSSYSMGFNCFMCRLSCFPFTVGDGLTVMLYIF